MSYRCEQCGHEGNQDYPSTQGVLASKIAAMIVTELTTTTGRGPERAKTTMGDNAVFVVLQDTLTKGERNLVAAGEFDAVLNLRRLWQKIMRESCSAKLQVLTGRKVIGFMSDNHIDPDIGVEVFILEPLHKKTKGLAAA